MTENKDALLPCPFCGTQPEVDGGDYNYPWVVECVNVDCPVLCAIDGADRKKEAIDAWNTRATPPAQDAKLRAVLEACAATIENHARTGFLEGLPGIGAVGQVLRDQIAALSAPQPESVETRPRIVFENCNVTYRDGDNFINDLMNGQPTTICGYVITPSEQSVENQEAVSALAAALAEAIEALRNSMYALEYWAREGMFGRNNSAFSDNCLKQGQKAIHRAAQVVAKHGEGK